MPIPYLYPANFLCPILILPLSKHPPKQKTLVLSSTQPSLQLAQPNQEPSPTEKTVNSLSSALSLPLFLPITAPNYLFPLTLCSVILPDLVTVPCYQGVKYPGESSRTRSFVTGLNFPHALFFLRLTDRVTCFENQSFRISCTLLILPHTSLLQLPWAINSLPLQHNKHF